MTRSQPPLPPLDGAPGPAAAASRAQLRALRDRVLEGARRPQRGLRSWLRPLPIAAALGLSMLLGGTSLAAVRAWPALRAYFAPAPAPTASQATGVARMPPPTRPAGVAAPEPATAAIVEAEPPARMAPPAAPPSRRDSKAKAAVDRLARANELRAQRRWSAAEALYLEVLASGAGVQPSSAAALAAAELRLYQLGRPRAALPLFRRVLALEPSSALAEQARHGIALCHRAQGDRRLEREALESFVKAHPTSPMRERAEGRLGELRSAPLQNP